MTGEQKEPWFKVVEETKDDVVIETIPTANRVRVQKETGFRAIDTVTTDWLAKQEPNS